MVTTQSGADVLNWLLKFKKPIWAILQNISYDITLYKDLLSRMINLGQMPRAFYNLGQLEKIYLKKVLGHEKWLFKKVVLGGLRWNRIQIGKPGHGGSRGLTCRLLSQEQNSVAEGMERGGEISCCTPSLSRMLIGNRGSPRTLTWVQLKNWFWNLWNLESSMSFQKFSYCFEFTFGGWLFLFLETTSIDLWFFKGKAKILVWNKNTSRKH